MNSKSKKSNIFCAVMAVLLCITACENNLNTADNKSSTANSDSSVTKNADWEKKKISDSKETMLSNTTVQTDLKPSEGFDFENNGDGTCTIVGIGRCKDKNIVIPNKDPNGDVVTRIGEYALYTLEDIDSVTLVNYNYEIGSVI